MISEYMDSVTTENDFWIYIQDSVATVKDFRI